MTNLATVGVLRHLIQKRGFSAHTYQRDKLNSFENGADPAFRLFGKITSFKVEPTLVITLRTFDLDLRRLQLLGKVTTDETCQYKITFVRERSATPRRNEPVENASSRENKVEQKIK